MTGLRILLVVTKMDEGGAMVLPVHLAAALRARGHTVEVWYLYREKPAYEGEPGVRILCPDKAAGPIGYLQVFVTLLRAMRRFRPDVVHGVLPLGNVLGLLAAWLLGCRRRIASQHTPLAALHPAMRFVDKIAGTIGIYTVNVAVSQAVAAGAAAYPGAYVRRVRVIRNAIPDIQADCTQGEARSRFELPADAWIIGTVGRLSPEKDHAFLIRVLAVAPGVHAAIAGAGEERAACEALAQRLGVSDRVHFLGSVPRDNVPVFLRALDVFVLPSRFEGLPISLIEAMKMALPVIASDIAPVREVLCPDGGTECGIVRATESPEIWAEAIAELRDQPETYGRFVDLARTRVADFSLDAMVDRYDRLFRGERIDA